MGRVEGGEPTEPTELGRLVKRYRKARNMSGERLSALIGKSNGYIAQLETGARGKRPDRDAVIGIAQQLGAPLSELLQAAGLLEPGEELAPPGRPRFEDFVNTDQALTIGEPGPEPLEADLEVSRSGCHASRTST